MSRSDPMEEDGLFDQSHMEDEPFEALPPPQSPGQTLTDPFGDAENGEVSKLADVPEAKRKGVKRPQPKLDSNRLISERGLPALRNLFSNVHYRGKGHEAEDLRVLMKRMENWAHRLFPKLQFEDFIDKVERLGSKKEVQTCLKRIRLDMPLTHDDYMSKEGDQEEPELQVFGDPDPFGGEPLSSPPFVVSSTPGTSSTPAPGASSTPAPGASSTPAPGASSTLAPGASSTPATGASSTPAPHTYTLASTPAPGASSPPSLSEEQRRRMEENRLKALERRLARQKQQQQLSESQTEGSQLTEHQALPTEPTEVQAEPQALPTVVQAPPTEPTEVQAEPQALPAVVQAPPTEPIEVQAEPLAPPTEVQVELQDTPTEPQLVPMEEVDVISDLPHSVAQAPEDEARSGVQTPEDEARSGVQAHEAQAPEDEARCGVQTPEDEARSGVQAHKAQAPEDEARSGVQTPEDEACSGAQTPEDEAHALGPDTNLVSDVSDAPEQQKQPPEPQTCPEEGGATEDQ